MTGNITFQKTGKLNNTHYATFSCGISVFYTVGLVRGKILTVPKMLRFVHNSIKPTLSLLLLLMCAMGQAQAPNVVVVLADDIGTGDVSFYQRLHRGNVVVETPAIDQLARQGMVLTNAHSPAALCAPSRYSVMTGCYTIHSYRPWGVWGAYEKSPIEEDQLTLGKLMKKAGYVTGFFGKWHMGGDWERLSDTAQIYRGPRHKPELDVDITKRVGGGPLQNGFDYAFTFPSGIQDVPYAVYENGSWVPLGDDSKIGFISRENMLKKGVKLDKSEGLGDINWDPHSMGPLLAKKAVDFIHAQADSDQPFFMYYCSQAVHLPHTPPGYFNGQKIAGATSNKHLDMLVELDQQVAMLVTALKDKDLYKNTLFIFTSDNGGLAFPTTLATGHRPSAIFNGAKNSIFEGGHRVPFIAVWPERITTGSQSHEPAIGLDILATLASLSGQDIPKDQAVDSHDLMPVFMNEPKAQGHQNMLIQGGTGKEMAFYEGKWKLVVQFDKQDKTNSVYLPKALYNLEENISEDPDKNLLETEPGIVKSLFEKFYQLLGG